MVRVALGAYRDMTAYRDSSQWVARMRCGMEKDFSWNASAGEYVELYRRLVSS
jgi:glycogen synthase